MLLQDKKANAWGNGQLEKSKKAGTAYGGFFRLLKGHNYEHEKDESQAGRVPRAGQKSQDDSCGHTIEAMPSVCFFFCFVFLPPPATFPNILGKMKGGQLEGTKGTMQASNSLLFLKSM